MGVSPSDVQCDYQCRVWCNKVVICKRKQQQVKTNSNQKPPAMEIHLNQLNKFLLSILATCLCFRHLRFEGWPTTIYPLRLRPQRSRLEMTNGGQNGKILSPGIAGGHDRCVRYRLSRLWVLWFACKVDSRIWP